MTQESAATRAFASGDFTFRTAMRTQRHEGPFGKIFEEDIGPCTRLGKF